MINTYETREKIETVIDRNIDPRRIMSEDINAYDCVELIDPAGFAFKEFCRKVNGDDRFYAVYYEDSQVFAAELESYAIYISISLVDVVRRKWATGVSFTKALLLCASDIVVSGEVAMEHLCGKKPNGELINWLKEIELA